jgi:hypothetical protein
MITKVTFMHSAPKIVNKKLKKNKDTPKKKIMYEKTTIKC